MKHTIQPKLNLALEETIAAVRSAEMFRHMVAEKIAFVTGKAIKRKRPGRLAQLNKKRKENRTPVFACIFGESDDYYSRCLHPGL